MTDRQFTERVAHELKKRNAIVVRTERITPGMLRVEFQMEDMATFSSLSPDDNVKIFIKSDATVVARNYTPRRFDRAANSLTIDFALHEAGPATRWALRAEPGDFLEIGGPRKSFVVSPAVRKIILIGDETALPAIGRWIEEAPSTVDLQSVIVVEGAREEQNFVTGARVRINWVHRGAASPTDSDVFVRALESVDIDEDTYVWIAAESTVVRYLHGYVSTALGVSKSRIRACGYWKKGKADVSEDFD